MQDEHNEKNHQDFSDKQPDRDQRDLINQDMETELQAAPLEPAFTDSLTFAPQKQEGSFRGRVLFAAIAIVLCATLSFFAGFAGAFLANHIEQEDVNTPPADDRLYTQDAASLLEKDSSQGSVYGSAGEDVLQISQVVNQVQDAVVVIDARSNLLSFYGGTKSSSGSGVIISENGYILTCHHVVESANEIYVTLNSGSKYEARLVGSDPTNDLAVLRIRPKEGEPLTYVKQGCSEDLVLGESVIAIGNSPDHIGGTVTNGIVSATDLQIQTTDGTVKSLLQTNAVITPGNSGGGLFNMDGKLVGIVNAKYMTTAGDPLALVIPIDVAYTVQLDLIQYGYVRGVIDHGLTTLDVTAFTQEFYYMQYRIDEIGVYIVSSEFDSAFQNLDRIVSVNGVAVLTTEALELVLSGLRVGDTVSVVLERENQLLTCSLILREYVPDYVKKDNK